MRPASLRPILVVGGARPNFKKVVPILHEFEGRGISRLFVHTGHHYDVTISDALLADLAAPAVTRERRPIVHRHLLDGMAAQLGGSLMHSVMETWDRH